MAILWKLIFKRFIKIIFGWLWGSLYQCAIFLGFWCLGLVSWLEIIVTCRSYLCLKTTEPVSCQLAWICKKYYSKQNLLDFERLFEMFWWKIYETDWMRNLFRKYSIWHLWHFFTILQLLTIQLIFFLFFTIFIFFHNSERQLFF